MCSTCGCSDNSNLRLELHGTHSTPGGAHHHPTTHVHEHEGSHTHSHGHPGEHYHNDLTEHRGDNRILHLEQDVLSKNNLLAARNRGWFEGRGIAAINLMSSPGAGKTTLLERTIRQLSGDFPIAVVEGDQETARDAERIADSGAAVVQINTGNGCHLDAAMLAGALARLKPPAASLLLIENVGNLVCPALFDLGECARVVVASITEGEDKPLKYPNMFRAAELLLLNKLDLLPHLRFELDQFLSYARQVNPQIKIFPLAALNGQGMEPWYAWLRQQVARCTG